MMPVGKGESIEVSGVAYAVKRLICAVDAVHSYHVVGPNEKRALLWTGDTMWAALVDRVFTAPDAVGLPRLIADDRSGPRVKFVLEAPPTTSERFNDDIWRAAPRAKAILALQKLTELLAFVHGTRSRLFGLRRDEIEYDLTTHRFHLVAAPRIQVLGKPGPEAAWRDMRIVGELLFEGFLSRDYPGGHQMAALLQDNDAIRSVGMTFPGLAQVLAGCVSPYGDLAYLDPGEVWEGLEQLRLELDKPFELRVGSMSTIGNYIFRKNNQDSCGHIMMQSICGSRKVSAGFFCVADGIGGIQDGEKASGLAVQTACRAFARAWIHYEDKIVADPVPFATAIAKVVGQRLSLEGEFHPSDNRGGTTFTGLLIAGGRASICHVGDSRAMLHRDGATMLLTRDHTLASILIELGEMTEEEAAANDLSQRTISRFLSTSAEVELDRIDGLCDDASRALGLDTAAIGFEVRRGDTFVLTSDGAHGEIEMPELDAMLDEHRDAPQALSEAMVNQAIDRLGRDNSTALVLSVR